jgi:hypothetical protein
MTTNNTMAQPYLRVPAMFRVLVALALAVASLSAVRAACGNGVIEAGEQCDDGLQNGDANSCCTTSCQLSGEVPDVIVGDLIGKTRWGVIGGIHAFSVGTTSCNIGSCWLNWISSTNRHPVIGQNMYRLKNGRFEQIGQSWLKHGFTALAETLCSTACIPPPDGSHLGVNCSDPYSSSLNGSQTRLGPKFEVNPVTGVFPYPATDGSRTGNVIYKRLQVRSTDLDPSQNAGALYWVEGQYVTGDDASANNQNNNASSRTMTVSTISAGNFDITLTGTTQRLKTAIENWPTIDPGVVLTNTNVPGDGRIILGARATSLGGGQYHYEYAFYNMNAERAIGSFSVPIPPGAVVTNVGFHDVDYHSGEPFSGTDWPSTVNATSVTWNTETFAANPNANALRWGTLYNFRFDANIAPGTFSVTAGIFKPGSPTSFTLSTVAPSLCNNDGVCGSGEDCSNCPSDCSGQGGGPGCCGNGTCEVGENPCRCFADCGAQQANEFSCQNGNDDDCDSRIDCADVDCCIDAACAGVDHDGDSHPCDCDDNNPLVWYPPTEARDLSLTKSAGVTDFSWLPPLDKGAVDVSYEMIRSANPADFVTAASCVALANPSNPSGTDSTTPAAGQAFHYLVRAKNGCPSGLGPLGFSSQNQPIAGRNCP